MEWNIGILLSYCCYKNEFEKVTQGHRQ